MKIKAIFFDIDAVLAPDPSFEKPAKLRQGIPNLLKELKSQSLKIGLIANVSYPGKFYEEILAALKVLSYFDVRIWSSEVGVKKPHPMIFYQAIYRLGGIAAGESVYVSHHFERDILSANRAGLPGIWLNRTQKSRENPFSREVKKASEIPKILENGFFLDSNGGEELSSKRGREVG